MMSGRETRRVRHGQAASGPHLIGLRGADGGIQRVYSGDMFNAHDDAEALRLELFPQPVAFGFGADKQDNVKQVGAGEFGEGTQDGGLAGEPPHFAKEALRGRAQIDGDPRQADAAGGTLDHVMLERGLDAGHPGQLREDLGEFCGRNASTISGARGRVAQKREPCKKCLAGERNSGMEGSVHGKATLAGELVKGEASDLEAAQVAAFGKAQQHHPGRVFRLRGEVQPVARLNGHDAVTANLAQEGALHVCRYLGRHFVVIFVVINGFDTNALCVTKAPRASRI